MAKTKSYYKDHYILLLCSLNIFLTIILIVFISARLISTDSPNYIVQCRNCTDPTALNKYVNGSYMTFISFMVFGVLILIFNLFLSFKTYYIRKGLSIMILYLGILLEILSLIISNALFILK
jgi:hypothetical protein